MALAPLAMMASSLVSGKSRGVQSYSPNETELAVQNPPPETQEPALGVDNNENTSQTKKGKSALVIQRNPSVGVSGSSSGSGLAVAGG